MTIARELVTVLRYEIDDANLRKYQNTKAPGSGADWQQAPRNIDGVTNAFRRLKGMLAGLAAGFTVSKLVGISDEWSTVRSRVGLVTEGVDEQKEALDGLFDIAQKTGQGYAAAGQVFQSTQRNAKDLGLTLQDNLTLTEAIGTAMTIGGGSQASQEAALVQLGQALGSGTLRGEELNSILEQAPRLAQAIAESFDVSVGKLKDMGKAGDLSSKALAKGLIKQLPKLRKEMERVAPTFAISLTRLQNSAGQLVDKWSRALGLAERFARVTGWVARNLERILGVVALIGSTWALQKVVALLGAAVRASGLLSSQVARLAAARAFGVLLGALARWLAIGTAIYYVFDDIFVWFQGGQSVIGRILGPTADWLWVVEAVRDAFAGIVTFGQQVGAIFPGWADKLAVAGVILAGIVLAIGAIPTLIIAVLLAWGSVFNFVHKNWDWIVADFREKIDAIGGWFSGMWDGVVAYAKGAWAKIKSLASDAVPDWIKSGASFIGGAINSGRQALGTTSGVPLRAAALGGGTSTVTQAPQITINAPNSNPATIAAAASSGVREGLSASAMVPQVEVAR